MAYRFIEENQPIFGIRWLLRRLGIHPNAYYNYLKHRKSAYYAQKEQIKEQIRAIYHAHGGVDGYRQMKVYLERRNIKLSVRTVHRYMNTEMGLMSVVRRKRPGYQKGNPHKVFRNILEQDFSCDEINTKWCTDFTYLNLTDGSKRYNCTIIDLHDRSVVASVTDINITSDLAIRTLRKAIESQPEIKGVLILHSDYAEKNTMPKFYLIYDVYCT